MLKKSRIPQFWIAGFSIFVALQSYNFLKMENTANEPAASYGQPLNFEKVWLMFQEIRDMFRETDMQFKESERILNEKFKEVADQFKESDKRIKALDQLFNSQWGKLVESLVEGDLVKLLNKKGIAVKEVLTRKQGNLQGTNYEFDLIAVSPTVGVFVEVKTTLRPGDVNKFVKSMQKIRDYFPMFSNLTVYGAVAYITAHADSHVMAENKGFFVIRATGSSASIINSEDFEPRKF